MWWENRQAVQPAVDKLSELIRQGEQRIARAWGDRGYDLVVRTDSPIEAILLAALYKDHDTQKFDVTFAGRVDEPVESMCGKVVIYQQAKIAPYRVDFLIDDSSSANAARRRWIVVECDGHDFHERTKEQARRDRARDRFLQSKGCRVLRFTGSEIWADPEACAAEIWRQIAVNEALAAGEVAA